MGGSRNRTETWEWGGGMRKGGGRGIIVHIGGDGKGKGGEMIVCVFNSI